MGLWGAEEQSHCGWTHRARRWGPRCCGWRSRRMRILEVSREGRVLRLVLNRPEKRNALSGALCQELVSAIEQGDRDVSIGAILLSGAGKSFCSGMDLTEMLTPVEASLSPVHEQLFTISRRVT